MFYLKRNLPIWERALRVSAAIALGAVVAMKPVAGPLAWLLASSAAVLLFTGFVGFCPACAMVGRQPPREKP